MKQYKHGEIIWRDLATKDAENIKNFYEQVLGWTTTEHDMGEYNDYNVHLKGEKEPFTGICFQKGENSDIPNVWMNYIYVNDVEEVIDLCVESGGSVIVQRKMGNSDFAILKDPSGAVFAIIH